MTDKILENSPKTKYGPPWPIKSKNEVLKIHDDF